jgi:TRAP-type mannitol/chloroaromatic compound transport system permease small subunit
MLLAAVQLAFYPLVLAAIVYFVWREGERPLRADAAIMSKSVRFIIRWAFFSVLLVGLGDIIVSFMRIEGMLPGLVGEETASAWGFNDNRAPMLHLPLIGISLLLAMVLPTLGFHWLAVLVVLSELLIVLTRFIFSYEQAFQGDLVRFWYGALFLFASAYTLTEDGHVRVDVFYAGLRRRTQGKINAFGCVVMGILFCWVILYFGMASRSAVITAPLISLEVTQAGFGLYVKYLMAAFLGIFAVTMMIQFCAYLLESIADARGDSGGAPHHVHGEDAVTEV